MSYEPYPSGQDGQQLEPGQRPAAPQSVQLAVRLMYAGAAVSAISLIVGLVTIGSVKHTILAQHPGYSASQVNSLATSQIASTVIAGLIVIGLWLWMARANRAGKNWARITGTVFFAFSTLEVVAVFAARFAGGTSAVIGIVIWLIGLATVVLLWRRESSAFFKPPAY